MMNIFIPTMLLLMSLIMFFLNHPLSMGLMILIQTLFMCLLTGMLIKTYWFSYILFLTFLGGLLVLFIYVTSIASNSLFKININMKIITMTLIFFSMFFYLFMYKINWINLNFNLEMNNFNQLLNLMMNNENKINLNKLYNNQNYFLMMLMIIYLFIALLAMVKITNIFYGPLRSST